MKKILPTSTTLSVNKKGFTLVELLVVISIIAILSIIGLTVFTGVQKNARDARRQSDVDAIAKALETTYNNATAAYPAIDCTKAFSQGTCPQDPLGGHYIGMPFAGAATFEICADLEKDGLEDDTLPAAKDYCRKNQQ